MRNNQDIIERKHAEQELAESEARYRALAEGSPLAVLVCRSDKDDDEVVLVNTACVELFGVSSPEELIGRSALDLFHPDSQKLVRGPIREATSATVPFVEAQIVRFDGTLVDVDIAAAPLLDQGMPATEVVLRDITELKKAHEQAALLAAIITSSPDAIFTKDLHEMVMNWNPAAEALYGYAAEEIVGTNMEVLVPPGGRGASRKLTKRLSRGEPIEQFETQCLRKDGSLIDVALTLFPILDGAGNAAAISITAHDISDRKQAEQERLRAEKFFRDTFEHADVGIAHVNSTDGTWLRVNQRLCDMLGYSREELMATTFLALSHPDDVEENVRGLQRMAAGEQDTYAADKRYLRTDGSIIWVHLNIVLIRKEDGTPDYNLDVIVDITERKRAEEALTASERFRGRLLDTSPNLIYIYDVVENRNVYTNREVAEFLGYSSEQIVAFRSALFEHILHPDDAQLVAEHHERLHTLPPGDDRVLEIDYRMKRADGEWRWFHSRDIPFARDDMGVVTQILGSTDDVTEQRVATERLQESEAKLKALFELLPVGVSVLDADNRVTYANPALERIVGLTGEELGEGAYFARTCLDGNGDPLSPDGFASARAAREGRAVEVETGVVKEDGQVVWVDVRATPIAISDWRTITVTADITADKAARELAARQAERIERTLTSAIDIAGNIVELRDPYTAGHQRRVSELAVRMAERLGMSGHEVDDIRVAGLLHDMGKAGIPSEILSKPGALSPIELTLVKGHAEAGYRLAVSANMAEPIAEMIYEHHERADGSGYPRGLTGDQTLLGAKVLAVADVVEAMMSHRPYRPTLGIKAALAEIERGAGTLYDAGVVEACVRLFNEDGFEFSA